MYRRGGGGKKNVSVQDVKKIQIFLDKNFVFLKKRSKKVDVQLHTLFHCPILVNFCTAVHWLDDADAYYLLKN